MMKTYLTHLSRCSSGGTSTVDGVQAGRASGDLLLFYYFAQKYTEWVGGVEPLTVSFLLIVSFCAVAIQAYDHDNPEEHLGIIGYHPRVKLTERLSLC